MKIMPIICSEGSWKKTLVIWLCAALFIGSVVGFVMVKRGNMT
jgi:hypothetical protein